MSDPAPNPPPSAPVAEFRVPTAFFLGMSHWIRVWMIQQMAEGAEITPSLVARQFQLNGDSANHHCKMLLKGGLVSSRKGEDRRTTVYFIPEPIRQHPGFLDYGWCQFRIR